jgi:putative membrane fusion protein
MKQKNKNNSNIVKVLIVLLLISFILYYIDNLKVSIDSYTAEIDILEDKIQTKAVVIKNEEVYFSDYSGSVKYYFEEGDRVKKGALLATIYLNNQASKINEEVDKIEKAIISKESNLDSENNVEILKNIEEEIQNLILENNKEEALKIIEAYKNQVNYKNEYTNLSLEELKEKKEALISSLSENNINIYSQKSGMVSYQMDNVENIYNIEKLDRYNSGDYNLLEIKTDVLRQDDEVSYGDPVIKIINNFNWYLLFNAEISRNIETESLNVRLNKIEEIVKAQIYKKNKTSDKTFLILNIDKYFNEFINDRYIDIELILDRYEGIRIKNSSIVEKGNQKGVYVIGASKIVRFYPIKPKGIGEEYLIIDEGSSHTINSRGQIEINGENYYTVKLYDKIISNPDDVKEGEILR